MQKQRLMAGAAAAAVVLVVGLVVAVALLAGGGGGGGGGNGPSPSAGASVLPPRLDPALCPAGYGARPLLLVSLDGFRAEYLERGFTPTLLAMGERGVRAPYMIPVYPTSTFPNHYSIVTGLYPESHGIVSNRFYDPVFREGFNLRDGAPSQGRWWGGEPLWSTLSKQNKKSATFFWPGSEAEIAGHRPTLWRPYDARVPAPRRVQQVLEWLSLPAEERPAFVSLYFSQPDREGHASGPDSQETNHQLLLAEEQMVQLVQGLSERQLLHCVNMIVLSDHGMAAAGKDRVIGLQKYVPELNDVALTYFGAVGMFSLKEDNDDMKHEIMSNLSCKRPDMRVYSPADLPKRFHFSNNRRISDVIVNLDAGKTVTTNTSWFLGGQHGYDNYFKEMRALFVAYGPDLQQGLEIEPFQNIELYNFMCQLTGVEPAENNGTWGALNHALAQPPPTQQLQQEFKLLSASLPEGDVSDRLVASRCEGDSAAAQTWLSSLKLTQTQELELEEYHLPWGVPQTGSLSLSLKLLLHHDHVTGYSERLRMPLWTSFTVKEGFPGTVGAPWTADVRLASAAASSCPELQEFADQGFAAEPLFPPAFSRNASLPEVPFLTSNALAMSPSLARRWKGLLEELVPAWVSAHGTLNVVLGPVFDNDTDSLLDDISRLRSPEIPSDLFALVTRCKQRVESLDQCQPHQLDSLSFIFSQSQSVSNCLTTEQYALEFSGRVRDVELATGLTVFPSLTVRDRLGVLLRTHSVLWSTV